MCSCLCEYQNNGSHPTLVGSVDFEWLINATSSLPAAIAWKVESSYGSSIYLMRLCVLACVIVSTQKKNLIIFFLFLWPLTCNHIIHTSFSSKQKK